VEVITELPVFRGGSTYAGVFTNSVPQLRPAILAAGATEAEIDEVFRIIEDPTQWFTMFATSSVRGHAPAG